VRTKLESTGDGGRGAGGETFAPTGAGATPTARATLERSDVTGAGGGAAAGGGRGAIGAGEGASTFETLERSDDETSVGRDATAASAPQREQERQKPHAAQSRPTLDAPQRARAQAQEGRS